MDIYDTLSNEHRQFEKLLDRLVSSSKAGTDDWKPALDELRRRVVTHAHAEEAVFYNALREEGEAKGLVVHSYAEHATAEGELRTLSAAKAIDANWTSLIEKFSKDLRHHIQEEESRVFDAGRQVFTDEEAELMGQAFERMKQETAKGGDSIVASTIDLIANMMPPRMAGGFRKQIQNLRKSA
ncbi:MAG TPA: hemerythrin domain-containing protein [Polyangiales bacterium]|nr:hemerythrin domain-containing protein [Polyangiales bacterium]